MLALPADAARRRLAIGVVGAGRLGSALTAALQAGGYTRLTVASRHPTHARALATRLGADATEAAALVAPCDLVFLAVPDAAIAPLAARLPWRPGQAVVHCSGALGLEVLTAAAATGGLRHGCLHPLQTFAAGTPAPEAPGLFRGIVCGVEADDEALGSLLEAIARDLEARPIRLEGVDRALYHAAAVLVSNDLVALVAAAGRVWILAGLPAAGAPEALGPLLRAAAANVATEPLAQALTGPVARGDVATVQQHLRALEAEPDLRELYRRLALELLRLDLGHPREVVDALRRALVIDEETADGEP